MINEVESKEWVLASEQELRIEVDHSEQIKIKLLEGNAEIFGSEIAQYTDYLFSGRKLAVFSWKGCRVQMTGSPSVAYVAGDTPMHVYLNAHFALQQLRMEAATRQEKGPRVIITGPSDVGKTSVCKILLNYCAKQGGKPIFIDIDTNEGSISVPGALTATLLTRTIDPEEDLGSTPLTTNTTPIVYYYGYNSPLDKPKYYSLLVEKLGQVASEKMEFDHECRSSGFVVNTPYQFAEGAPGLERLKKAIEALDISVIFVIGHERLYSDLKRCYSDESHVQVVKLPKSGGVVNRDKAFKKLVQSQKIKEYFYGNPHTALGRADLNPYSTTVNFHDIAIHRIGEGFLAPTSALPLGEDRKVDETQMVSVTPGNILLHSILALSESNLGLNEVSSENSGSKDMSGDISANTESHQLLSSNTAGFIYVASVDEAKKRMTILTPSPGRLPKKHLIMGELKWIEMN